MGIVTDSISAAFVIAAAFHLLVIQAYVVQCKPTDWEWNEHLQNSEQFNGTETTYLQTEERIEQVQIANETTGTTRGDEDQAISNTGTTSTSKSLGQNSQDDKGTSISSSKTNGGSSHTTSDSEIISDSIHKQPESTLMQSDSTQRQLESSQMQSESTQMQSDSTQMQSDSTQMQSDSPQTHDLNHDNQKGSETTDRSSTKLLGMRTILPSTPSTSRHTTVLSPKSSTSQTEGTRVKTRDVKAELEEKKRRKVTNTTEESSGNLSSNRTDTKYRPSGNRTDTTDNNHHKQLGNVHETVGKYWTEFVRNLRMTVIDLWKALSRSVEDSLSNMATHNPKDSFNF